MDLIGHKWSLIPNSSWGEYHKQQFGEAPGFLICYGPKLHTLASIVPQLCVDKKTVEQAAKLMSKAPEMYRLLQTMSEQDNDLGHMAKELIQEINK